MKSTGEVMGIDYNFGIAYYKAELAAGMRLPTTGTAFLSVKDRDKAKSVDVAKGLTELGFSILATKGTAEYLRNFGIETKTLLKTTEGRPNIVDFIINKEVDLIINTPRGKGPRKDGYEIRRAAIEHNVPYITTIPAALAAVKAGKALRKGTITMKPIQEYHAER
jgi:carbamoyl-phosphate synthase large subunit